MAAEGRERTTEFQQKLWECQVHYAPFGQPRARNSTQTNREASGWGKWSLRGPEGEADRVPKKQNKTSLYLSFLPELIRHIRSWGPHFQNTDSHSKPLVPGGGAVVPGGESYLSPASPQVLCALLYRDLKKAQARNSSTLTATRADNGLCLYLHLKKG